MILSGRNELPGEKRKNSLVTVTGIESQRLEVATLILYLFSCYCSDQVSSINDYRRMTNRSLSNNHLIRSAIKRLNDISIGFYDNDFKLRSQSLFEFCSPPSPQKAGDPIAFRINTFFASKLSIIGKGHVEIPLAPIVLKMPDYRHHLKNRIRLCVLLKLSVQFGSSQLSVREIEAQRTETVKQLRRTVLKYFILHDQPVVSWIFQFFEEYINYRRTEYARKNK